MIRKGADMSEPIDSADQDAWIEIVAVLRGKLAKCIELAQAMNPSELASLVGKRCGSSTRRSSTTSIWTTSGKSCLRIDRTGLILRTFQETSRVLNHARSAFSSSARSRF